MTVLVISILVALSVSAACSLVEAVLLSVTPTQVAELSARRPRLGVAWGRLKGEIHRPIAVILILNTAAHTVGATVAGARFEAIFGPEWIAAFSAVFTFLMLQFTEIMPKTLGVRFNVFLAPFVARPLEWLISLFDPVIRFLNLMNRPFERADRPKTGGGTLEEISALAGLARLSDLIGSHQERIIRGASHLSTKLVADVMIPVEQIAFLSTSQTMVEAVLTVHDDPHTRFPICEESDRNRVLGFINVKELVFRAKTNPADPSLRGIIRPVHVVRPDRTANELLHAFIEHHEHMAIVQDEGNQTLGLITMEDLVEELVGELEDEFDRLPRMCHALSGDIWMVGGGYPVAELMQRLGVSLPDAQGSISAWLIRRLDGLPRVNEVHAFSGISFMIRRIRRGKVFEVGVSRSGAFDALAVNSELRSGT